jgi:hypothetical protein
MCGQDATINYYEIGSKQNQDHNGKITTAAAARNCSSFMSRLVENQPIYCEKCITKIEKYINYNQNNKSKKASLGLKSNNKQGLIDYINQFDIDEIKLLDLNIQRSEICRRGKVKQGNIQYIDLHTIFTLNKNGLDK